MKLVSQTPATAVVETAAPRATITITLNKTEISDLEYYCRMQANPRLSKKLAKAMKDSGLFSGALAKEKASVEEPTTEEAKGVVSKLIKKAKRKIKGLKDTGHPLGNDLQSMMAQYAELKKAGKGESKKAKQLGEQIGKIKNSLRNKD